MTVLQQDNYPQNIDELKGIVIWDTSSPSYVAQAQNLAKQSEAQVVLADPNRNQQETLETIRFAYSLWEQDELGTFVEHSFEQFLEKVEKWRGKEISAFGNGPSLQKVVKERLEIGNTTRAVCNSTIGDEEALDFLKPELMFCGDPVQHCGVSLYAGRFRQDLARALLSEERVLFTQLGYVPYFRAVTHKDCHDRIIGIGNDRRPTFNLDLTTEYLTAATANIFTMLVLPVAFTLSSSVDMEFPRTV